MRYHGKYPIDLYLMDKMQYFIMAQIYYFD